MAPCPEFLERRELLAITFGDPDVELAVKAAVLAEPDDTSTVSEAAILDLKTLYLDSNQVSSLVGLQFATNLETLVLRPGRSSDAPESLASLGANALAPLAGLTSLTTVALSDTQVNLAALGSLTGAGHANLQTLDLSWNEYTSLVGMPNNLDGVRNLDLSYNQLDLGDAADLPADRFEKVASLKLYGNFDPADSGDQTFNPTHLRGLVIDYDLPTVNVEKVNNLPDLAKALHYSPVEIYEYIYNNIEYQAYDGVMKGAFATFNTHAGNAWDQSSLFLELLKETYTGTTFGLTALAPSIVGVRATAPEADVARLVGTVDASATEALLDASTNSAVYLSLNAVRSGGNIEFDHAYVQVTLPAPGGTAQFRLDPSWKLKEYSSGVTGPILGSLPFDRNAYLSVQRTDLAVEWYEKKAMEYLAEHNPGVSVADVGYRGILAPRGFTALPTFAAGTMDGYTYTVSTTNAYTFNAPNGLTINSGRHHRIGFLMRNLTKSTVSNSGNILYRSMQYLSQNPLMVRFSGANGGGTATLALETPTGTATLLNLTGFDATDQIELTVYHLPNDASTPVPEFTKTIKRLANQSIAIGLEANQITDSLLINEQDLLNDKMIAAVQQYWAGAVGYESIPLTPTDVGRLLTLAMWTYYRRVDQAQELADRLGHTVQARNFVQIGFASADVITSASLPTLALFENLQLPVQPQNVFIDIPGGFVDAGSIYAGGAAERNELMYFNFSAQEHAIWEELTNTKGMSTVKSLQLAEDDPNNQLLYYSSSGGQSQYDDFEELMNALDASHSQYFRDALTAANADGYTTFIVPQKPTPLDGWNGAGFFAENASQRRFAIIRSDGVGGDGGFRITGATNANPADLDSKWFNSLNGDPVNIANGAVVDNVVDIDIPRVGDVSLRFERYYDSESAMTDTEANSHGHLGRGWYHSFGDYLKTGTYRGAPVNDYDRVWVDEKGQQYTFTALGGGQFQTPGELRGEFKPNASGDGFYFQDKNGIRRVFDGWGRLQSVRDRNFNAVTVYYVTNTSTDFRIYRLEHNRSAGRYLQFGYDYTGGFTRIATIDYVIPPNPNAYMRWNYDHGADGSLIAVRSFADASNPESKIEYSYYVEPQFAGTRVAGKLKQIVVLQDANAPGGPRSSAVTHMYYANGRAFQMTDGLGYGQNFTYDLYRNRTRFLDEHYETTATSYDSEGHTLEVSRPDGAKELFTWIGAGVSKGLLAEWTRGDNITESYTYGVAGSWDERLGNVTTLNEGRKYGSTFVTIANRTFNYCTETTGTSGTGCATNPGAGGELLTTSVTLESSPRGITTSYLRDDSGNVLTKTEAANQSTADQRVTTFEYWTGGLLKFMTDARGVATPGDATDYRTTYYYSTLGEGLIARRDTWISATQTAIETWAYDTAGFGYLGGYTDAENRPVTYETDLLGRRTKTTLPATQDVGATSATQEYFNDGTLKKSTDHLGRMTTYQYDGRRQLSRTTYADGAMTSVAYDARRNPQFSADEIGNVTAYVYDDRARQSGMLRADGGAEVNVLDVLGHSTLYVDALGRRTTSEYNARGWLVKTTSPTVSAGVPVTQYAYDLDGNMISQTDAEGRVTAFEYTPLNQLKKRTDPDPSLTQSGGDYDSPIWRFGYDKAGNLNAEIDPYNHQTLYNNDGLNRRTTEAFYEVSTACGGSFCLRYDMQTAYDKVGNVLWSQDRRDNVTSFVYDMRNQLRETREAEPSPGDASDDRPLTQYRRDAMGNVVIVVDPRDNQTNTAYDLRGRAKSSTAFDGREGLPGVVVVATSRTLRDAAGRVIGAEDARRYSSWMKLDAVGRTVETVDAGMERTRTDYDAAGNVSRQTDALGRETYFGYDDLNRLVQRIDPDPGATLDSPIWNYSYDRVGNQVTVTDPAGYQTVNTYDRLNRLGTEWSADPNPYDADNSPMVKTFTYDKMGRLTVEHDAAGWDTFYAYNALGQLLTKTEPDPDGVAGTYYDQPVWQYQYDVNGNLIQEIDPEGRKLEYEYDPLDRRMRKLYYRDNGTYAFDADYRYDPNGNLTWIQDEAVRDTFFEYDALNRQTKVTRPPAAGQTHVSQTSYDAVGNVRTTTDETGMVTNFHYDALGRNTYEALPGTGRVTRSTYDAVGNLKTVTNPNLQVTAYGYDNLNRRISETDAAAQTATTAYDLVGNVVQVVDRNNNVTNFTYTKLNQLRTEAKSGLSGTRTYEYNRLGGVTKYTDRDGRVIDTTFDRLNRPVGETWRLQAGGTVQNTLARQFNNAGQLENVKDNVSAIDFDYGDFGWKTSESNFIDDCLVVGTCPAVQYTTGIPATTISIGYDNYGNRALVNDTFDGSGQTIYDRDAAQRLIGIDRTVVSGSLNYTYGIDLTYDAADRLTGTTRTYTNANAAEYPTQPSTTLSYQTLTKRLASIAFTQPVGGFTESLTYDAADRLDSMTDQQGLHDYTFNGTDQLTAVDHPGAIADESFTLDVNGNRLNEMATTDAGVTSFANGRHNQLPLGNGAGGANNANNFDYFYDNEGHLKGAFDDANDKYYQFLYDSRGRMTRVNRRNGVNESAPVEHQTIYTYDALDRRIAKSVAGVVEEFFYDGDNLYLEFTGAGTTPSHRYQYADSVDAILADENLTVASGVVDWYQTDHEGSVRSVVRASDGALKNSLTYSAFGQLTESVPAFDQQFSYTGRELDEATGPNGLYYYRGRYYDAKLGRFLQQDPSGFSGCHRAVQMQPVGGELGQPGWMIVESVTVGKRA